MTPKTKDVADRKWTESQYQDSDLSNNSHCDTDHVMFEKIKNFF